MMVEQLEADLCVTPNARIVERITGIRRQIDVLIEVRHDTDNSRRIIVDAKKRSSETGTEEVKRDALARSFAALGRVNWLDLAAS